MKTKIFLAFIIVILAALLSNFIFEWLIMKDFDNYEKGVKEDQFYWILSSVEGSYSGGRWNTKELSESIHWSMMMGLNIKVLDSSGQEIISSMDAMSSLSGTMKKRMESLFHIHMAGGKFDEYPLYAKGRRIGTLLSRPFQKEKIKEKEAAFKERTKNFLYVSFMIAGGGSLLLALLFSQYLSGPLSRLKKAAEKIAQGDFHVRIAAQSSDEVGKLSESFNAMADSLQKEEKLRKHLMSNIAHELRTPLTIMKAHMEAMADGVIADKEKGLQNIAGEIERLIKLVKGIEDITVAEASFFARSETTETSLREFLTGIADDMLPAFKDKGLEVEISGKSDLVVAVDIGKLEKIVRNIMSNALKYTDHGGVSIDYGVDHEQGGSAFYIDFKDSGKGIPGSEITRIFDRFHRADRSGNDGLGLGLAIVKELVSVMGGKINVESEAGRGSAFRISLPIRSWI